jgi:uncharacterized membrane protein affecting hemolysin expression
MKQIIVGVMIAMIAGLSLWAIQGQAETIQGQANLIHDLSSRVAVHDSQLADNADDHREIKDALQQINGKCDRILESKYNVNH